MTDTIPPAAIFIIGALVIPFIKGRLKSVFMLLLPVLSFITLLNMPEGKYWVIRFLDYSLILGRVDTLSLVFGYIFTIISFLYIFWRGFRHKDKRTSAQYVPCHGDCCLSMYCYSLISRPSL